MKVNKIQIRIIKFKSKSFDLINLQVKAKQANAPKIDLIKIF